MKHITIALLIGLPQFSYAGGYFLQHELAGAQIVAGLDRDAVGNLYVLGLEAGATAYSVAVYRTPGMEPLDRFETTSTAPAAFAVEDSGVVDILDDAGGGAFALARYQNGRPLSQAAYAIGTAYNLASVAIDKANGRVYLAYQYTYSPVYLLCIGCGGPSPVTAANIKQYDLEGRLLASIPMPGRDSTPGSCYRPEKIGADAQGRLSVVDTGCQKLLTFSPTGTLVAETPAAELGQPYFINVVRVWSDPASNLYVSQWICGSVGCRPGVLKVSVSHDPVATLLEDAPVGCAWDERVLYVPSGGRAPLRRFVYNSPPTVPAETAPIGAVLQHSSAAALAWQQANDEDGDAVAYSVFLGTDSRALRLIGDAAGSPLASSPLTFGATYHWQVVAEDSYLGMPLQRAVAPVVSFNMALINQPPGAFSVRGGTGTAITRDDSVGLAWLAASDADEDPLVYQVRFGTDPARLGPIAETVSTSHVVRGLGFGTTYYWSVDAVDVYGASATLSGGLQRFLPLFLSEPPGPVKLEGALVGSPRIVTMRDSVAVSWKTVANPQEDPIFYAVYLGESPNDLRLLARIEPRVAPVVLSESVTQVQVDADAVRLRLDGLRYHRPYFLKVVASNPYGAASETPVQTFSLTPISGFPKVYNYPNPFSPARGGTNIVFNTPDSGYPGATLRLYSEFQELVLERRYGSIPPGISQVSLDGSGLHNGSYLCRVDFDGGDRETFYLMVVR